jgi:uncharacterized protein (DUF1501 family)
MMKRREFLRNVLAVSAGTAASLASDPFRMRMQFAHAQTATGKTLVVVFQRGGADGLSECVPYALSEYYNIRNDIAIPPPGQAGGAIDLDGFFGLHPALNPLKAVYDAGDLAIFPACHYPNATRSHFSGQRNLESGEDADNSDGWLNRYLVENQRQAPLRAIGFSSGLPHALKGDAVVSAFSNITNFTVDLNAAEEQELLQYLGSAYGQNPDPNRLTRELVMETGRVMVDNVGALAPIVSQNYTPANGATYPGSTFGRQMMQTAQLIKADVGLEVVAISIGGWDTHSDQGSSSGRMANRLAEFAGGLRAFHQDMGALMSDVVVLTMSEFGRTSVENGSNGSDHAHATTWFALGGPVSGGQVYPHPGGSGYPPGGSLQQVRGRYLNHSVDFRDVMGEILLDHLGAASIANVLPGHTYSPVGFIT